MSVTCLMRGMGIFGGEDPVVVGRIERAESEWGHLAVFPSSLRTQLAVYLGLMPDYDRYLYAWRACGLPEKQLATLGACTIERHGVLAVSASGVGGVVLGRILATGERVDGCVVMGDPSVEFRCAPGMLLKAYNAMELEELVPDVAVKDIGPFSMEHHRATEVIDVVSVSGDGLMDAVTSDRADQNLEAFVSDMVSAGLPESAVGALRSTLSEMHQPNVTERMLQQGEHRDEWRDYIDDSAEYGYIHDPALVQHVKRFGPSALALRNSIIEKKARDGTFKKPWFDGVQVVRFDGQSVIPCRRPVDLKPSRSVQVATRELCDAVGVESSDCESFESDARGDVMDAHLGFCHGKLTVELMDEPEVTWRQLVGDGRLKADAELAQYVVYPTGPDKWHVGEGVSGVSALAAVMSVRRGIKQGLRAVVMGGRLVSLDDKVGAASEYSVELVRRLPALEGVDPAVLDNLGMYEASLQLYDMDDEQRRRAGFLKPMGDFVFAYILAKQTMNRGAVVADFSMARESFTPDKFIAEKLNSSGLLNCIPGMPRVVQPKTAGQLVKSTIAVLFEGFGLLAAEQFIEMLQLANW